jgi:hypothetical protein
MFYRRELQKIRLYKSESLKKELTNQKTVCKQCKNKLLCFEHFFKLICIGLVNLLTKINIIIFEMNTKLNFKII